MSKSERENIVMNTFDDLWNELWINKTNKQFYNEYDHSKKKFNKLKNGYKIGNKTISMLIINSSVPYKYNTPEWGFPKGRRNIKETDINCAIREFREETSIPNNKYTIINSIKPIHEIFLGTNNIRYEHIYYIAKYNNNNNDLIYIDKNNSNMLSEISDIKWFSFEDTIKRIRPYNIEKKNAIKNANRIISNLN
jgi:8-oxo-dGTP pyrophosphatase MutT (NUDIX family)